MGILGPGEVLFLKKGSFVNCGNRSVEIGFLHDQPRDYSKARERLRNAIIAELNKAGGNFDIGMVTICRLHFKGCSRIHDIDSGRAFRRYRN